MDSILYYFGMFSSILLAITPYPQIYFTYISKSATNISTIYLILQLCACVCCIIFGILSSQIFIIIPNASILCAIIILLIMKQYFIYKV